MSRVLVDTTVIFHPATRAQVVLTKGDLLPEWADGMVGEHLLAPVDPVFDGGGVLVPGVNRVENPTGTVEQVTGTEVPAPSEPDTGGGPTTGPPPRAGKGSGRNAWADYAKELGFEVDDDHGRDDIIAAIEAEGLPT